MTDIDGWRAWLRSPGRHSALLGVALIGLVWSGVAIRLSTEMSNTLQAAEQRTGNLARSFEAHVARSIEEADKTLLFLRSVHVRKTWPYNSETSKTYLRACP